MTRTHTRDGDWIRACIARTPGAWAEFVRRTIPLSLYLVDRVFDKHGVISNEPDREQVVENLYGGLVVEDMKVLRSFQPGYDIFLWMTVRVRVECLHYISDSRRQSHLGMMRSVKEPDPENLVAVLHEIPPRVRSKLATYFEGPPVRVPDALRPTLAECRGKLVDLVVSGKAMTACMPFERLSAFADGVTTDKISLHINGCVNCGQELERIAAVNRLLRDLVLARPKGLPRRGLAKLVERVRLLLPTLPKPPRPRPRRRIGGRR